MPYADRLSSLDLSSLPSSPLVSKVRRAILKKTRSWCAGVLREVRNGGNLKGLERSFLTLSREADALMASLPSEDVARTKAFSVALIRILLAPVINKSNDLMESLFVFFRNEAGAVVPSGNASKQPIVAGGIVSGDISSGVATLLGGLFSNSEVHDARFLKLLEEEPNTTPQPIRTLLSGSIADVIPRLGGLDRLLDDLMLLVETPFARPFSPPVPDSESSGATVNLLADTANGIVKGYHSVMEKVKVLRDEVVPGLRGGDYTSFEASAGSLLQGVLSDIVKLVVLLHHANVINADPVAVSSDTPLGFNMELLERIADGADVASLGVVNDLLGFLQTDLPGTSSSVSLNSGRDFVDRLCKVRDAFVRSYNGYSMGSGGVAQGAEFNSNSPLFLAKGVAECSLLLSSCYSNVIRDVLPGVASALERPGLYPSGSRSTTSDDVLSATGRLCTLASEALFTGRDSLESLYGALAYIVNDIGSFNPARATSLLKSQADNEVIAGLNFASDNLRVEDPILRFLSGLAGIVRPSAYDSQPLTVDGSVPAGDGILGLHNFDSSIVRVISGSPLCSPDSLSSKYFQSCSTSSDYVGSLLASYVDVARALRNLVSELDRIGGGGESDLTGDEIAQRLSFLSSVGDFVLNSKLVFEQLGDALVSSAPSQPSVRALGVSGILASVSDPAVIEGFNQLDDLVKSASSRLLSLRGDGISDFSRPLLGQISVLSAPIGQDGVIPDVLVNSGWVSSVAVKIAEFSPSLAARFKKNALNHKASSVHAVVPQGIADCDSQMQECLNRLGFYAGKGDAVLRPIVDRMASLARWRARRVKLSLDDLSPPSSDAVGSFHAGNAISSVRHARDRLRKVQSRLSGSLAPIGYEDSLAGEGDALLMASLFGHTAGKPIPESCILYGKFISLCGHVGVSKDDFFGVLSGLGSKEFDSSDLVKEKVQEVAERLMNSREYKIIIDEARKGGSAFLPDVFSEKQKKSISRDILLSSMSQGFAGLVPILIYSGAAVGGLLTIYNGGPFTKSAIDSIGELISDFKGSLGTVSSVVDDALKVPVSQLPVSGFVPPPANTGTHTGTGTGVSNGTTGSLVSNISTGGGINQNPLLPYVWDQHDLVVKDILDHNVGVADVDSFFRGPLEDIIHSLLPTTTSGVALNDYVGKALAFILSAKGSAHDRESVAEWLLAAVGNHQHISSLDSAAIRGVSTLLAANHYIDGVSGTFQSIMSRGLVIALFGSAAGAAFHIISKLFAVPAAIISYKSLMLVNNYVERINSMYNDLEVSVTKSDAAVKRLARSSREKAFFRNPVSTDGGNIRVGSLLPGPAGSAESDVVIRAGMVNKLVGMASDYRGKVGFESVGINDMSPEEKAQLVMFGDDEVTLKLYSSILSLVGTSVLARLEDKVDIGPLGNVSLQGLSKAWLDMDPGVILTGASTGVGYDVARDSVSIKLPPISADGVSKDLTRTATLASEVKSSMERFDRDVKALVDKGRSAVELSLRIQKWIKAKKRVDAIRVALKAQKSFLPDDPLYSVSSLHLTDADLSNAVHEVSDLWVAISNSVRALQFGNSISLDLSGNLLTLSLRAVEGIEESIAKLKERAVRSAIRLSKSVEAANREKYSVETKRQKPSRKNVILEPKYKPDSGLLPTLNPRPLLTMTLRNGKVASDDKVIVKVKKRRNIGAAAVVSRRNLGGRVATVAKGSGFATIYSSSRVGR